MSPGELSGRAALVTGGTAGIGLESARLLAEAGAEVTITGRDVERGEKALAGLGLGVRFVAADLSDLDSVASLARGRGGVVPRPAEIQFRHRFHFARRRRRRSRLTLGRRPPCTT